MPAPHSIPKRFEILEELARGDFGVLLRARDTLLLREVLLKPPPPGWIESTKSGAAAPAERALREARALAGVQHPGVVRLFEVVDTSDGPLLVIEPVSGETLAERLRRERRLAPETVRQLGIALADALECVHASGVVHRGIALDTIALREDGRPLITGFDFAKFGTPGSAATPGTTFFSYKPGAANESARIAAPPHPAPEQLAGQRADARSDVFGLGWVLYECLTGEEPYAGLDVEYWAALRDPRSFEPSAPKELCDAIVKCLQVSPLKRFASAAALKSALVRVPTEAAPIPSAGGRSSKTFARPPLAIAAGIALFGVATWGALQFGPKLLHAGDADGNERGRPVQHGSADPGLAGRFPYDKLHAVIIGIDKYEDWPELHCAVNDAEDMRKLLESEYGFAHDDVQELLDGQATKAKILDVMGDLLHTGPDDGVVVFFAGHGASLETGHGQSVFLVPVGGSQAKERYASTMITLSEMQDWVKMIPAKHIFFALDCCYSGFATQPRGMESAPLVMSSDLATKRSRLVLTAGTKDQRVAEDDQTSHGLFTQQLIEGLRTGEADGLGEYKDGIITAMELANYVEARVPPLAMKAAHKQQTPQFGNLTGEEGQFLFIDKAARAKLGLTR